MIFQRFFDLIKQRFGVNSNQPAPLNAREQKIQKELKILYTTHIRLLILGGFFALGFAIITAKMISLASVNIETPEKRLSQSYSGSNRADIVDRNGRVLATNMDTNSLYAHPHQIVNAAEAGQALARIFPDIDAEKMTARLAGNGKFFWIKPKLSPEEKQAVHDIGEPGLLFGSRELRLYPNGKLAAHVLGGTGYLGVLGTDSAEIMGVAGVEKAFNAFLSNPKNVNTPLQLSLDLTVQATLENALYGGMRLMNAKAAGAVLMDVHTGEIVAMSSLPDFNPNKRPRPLLVGDQADDPLFNRTVQGLYELGSVFKLFTIAQALDLGLVDETTYINTQGPITVDGRKISDFSNYGPRLTVEKILVKSSNIGTVRIADMIGTERQKTFLDQLGFLKPTEIELIEGPTAQPNFPRQWRNVHRATISYGHGISSSQVHLAAAYATMVNGGTLIKPTVIKQNSPQNGPRIISEDTSKLVTDMLRKVVTEGTASFGDVPGYSVGGKTGTAEKINRRGTYDKDRIIATFASTFPTNNPEYVLIVTFDEAEDRGGAEPRRTAGWTAVPVAAEIIRRIAPLLDVTPVSYPSNLSNLTLSNY